MGEERIAALEAGLTWHDSWRHQRDDQIGAMLNSDRLGASQLHSDGSDESYLCAEEPCNLRQLVNKGRGCNSDGNWRTDRTDCSAYQANGEPRQRSALACLRPLAKLGLLTSTERGNSKLRMSVG